MYVTNENSLRTSVISCGSDDILSGWVWFCVHYPNRGLKLEFQNRVCLRGFNQVNKVLLCLSPPFPVNQSVVIHYICYSIKEAICCFSFCFLCSFLNLQVQNYVKIPRIYFSSFKFLPTLLLNLLLSFYSIRNLHLVCLHKGCENMTP